MGMNAYTRRQYANREFMLNTIAYLVDGTGILETRGKDYTLRLLDERKVSEEKVLWQVIGLAAPILLTLLLTTVFQAWRRKKYGRV
jgi:hypothetical protein